MDASRSFSKQPPKAHFQIIRKLGEGACSKVYLASETSPTNPSEQSLIAIKVVADRRFQSAARCEFNITKDIHHPNIVRALRCFQTAAQELVLVQEYVPKGDLFSYVESQRFEELTIRRYATGIIDAVEHLHQHNIVHRDLKPDNILIGESDTAKICDFGMADYHGAKVFSGRGTLPYMAPELVHCHSNLIADKSHDVWALGVTIFVLLTGAFPWEQAVPGDALYDAFLRRDFHILPSWQSISPELTDFFHQHVFVPQQRRCTVSQLRKMFAFNWFRHSALTPEISASPVRSSDSWVFVQRMQAVDEPADTDLSTKHIPNIKFHANDSVAVNAHPDILAHAV